jgi:hypothetical protein
MNRDMKNLLGAGSAALLNNQNHSGTQDRSVAVVVLQSSYGGLVSIRD